MKTILLTIVLLLPVMLMSGCSSRKSEVGPEGIINPESAPLVQEKDENGMRLIDKDYFSLEAPENWQETSSLPGISLFMVNREEKIDDPAAQKINFRSYFSVSYQELADMNLDEQVEVVKSQVRQVAPDIEFFDGKSLTVNGSPARVLVGKLSQQGVNFKVMVVVAPEAVTKDGKGSGLWVMSFNTLEDNWNENEDLFYRIAGSFGVK
jgi:hypothetical protein